MSDPDAALAAGIAAEVTGGAPVAVSRFTTGAMHFVFEAQFAAGPPVVVRIAAAYGAEAMRGAANLSTRLRPLGVPLPEIIAQHLYGPHPWLVLERLPGSDLGDVIGGLDAPRIAAIAAAVAAAQAIVASTPSAGRYGYAAEPGDAPMAAWSAVIDGHIARSRTRIAAAGVFDPSLADALASVVELRRAALDAIAATPFLHDTTTKNVIVMPDGGFSGIVDVDDLCFGDPRYAIALTAAALRNRGLGTSYIDIWLQCAELADGPLFQLYVAAFLLDFLSEHGQRFNGNERSASPAARQHLLRLFDAALCEARDG